MNIFLRRKIDLELKNFTSRSLVRPTDCRDADHVRLYIRELSKKIDEYERESQYVPDWTYALLAQYNHAHDRIVHKFFTETYS